MPNIVIAGGGFAGVWAAASAVRLLSDRNAVATVTLVSAGDDLVIRPRLYESQASRAGGIRRGDSHAKLPARHAPGPLCRAQRRC